MFLVATVSLMFANATMADGGKNELVLINKSTNTYIDAHEVTVGDWCLFLEFYKKVFSEKPQKYADFLPNHEICTKAYGSENYLTDSKYRNYPMVGITYQQMKMYCGWRTDNVNKELQSKKSKQQYIYSLPEEADLQAAYDLQSDKNPKTGLRAVDENAKTVTGIIDNAQEMTQNKKVVTGVTVYGLRFENVSEPSALVGFRCKCVINNL
jgi:formylglycine-generating enzyme required for sulfatase activity